MPLLAHPMMMLESQSQVLCVCIHLLIASSDETPEELTFCKFQGPPVMRSAAGLGGKFPVAESLLCATSVMCVSHTLRLSTCCFL